MPALNNPDSTTAIGKQIKMNIIISSKHYTAVLEENATSKAFTSLLPLTINRVELNGNEKYINLPHNLPMNAKNPRVINNGDLMLYGSSTLVLFYKSFTRTYRYTKIGSIDHPLGLADALGTGVVKITFGEIK